MAKNRKSRHIRTSKKGKKFSAGRGKKIKKQSTTVPMALQRQILAENRENIARELKQKNRVRIPDIGVLRLKIKPAKKGGKKIVLFGKETVTKSKPRRKVIKFFPAKALKQRV